MGLCLSCFGGGPASRQEMSEAAHFPSQEARARAPAFRHISSEAAHFPPQEARAKVPAFRRETSEAAHFPLQEARAKVPAFRREMSEADRLASQEARAKAAEAAERRQREFDNSAYGRATRGQMAAQEKAKKQYGANGKGEPVLKWQMG